MAVFRIERTRDYTVMSNHHLRNANLSLKAKGLLSMMLSLPEDWNYTTRGLAKICKEGVDAIGAALRELEAAGYIVRHKLRDRQGRISDTEYVIYEQPQLRKPDTDSPDTENPYMDKPDTEKPAELNIEKSNTQKQNIYGSSTDSIPFRDCAADCLPERKGRDAMSLTEIESYRELIQENIGYEYLCQQYETYREDLDEIVELIVETVCAKRKTTRIAGSDFPHEIVRSRFLKLDNSHIEFVMDCLQKNTTEIRNMKQYLLVTLMNVQANYEGAKLNKNKTDEDEKQEDKQDEEKTSVVNDSVSTTVSKILQQQGKKDEMNHNESDELDDIFNQSFSKEDFMNLFGTGSSNSEAALSRSAFWEMYKKPDDSRSIADLNNGELAELTMLMQNQDLVEKLKAKA